MNRVSLAFVLLCGSACAYDFDPRADLDRFACTVDADCLVDEGYVCAGFYYAQGSLTSYCVKDEDAVLGFLVSIPAPFPEGCDLGTVTGVQNSAGLFLDPAEPLEPAALAALVESHAYVGTCETRLNLRGGGEVFCATPRGSSTSAAIFVSYDQPGGAGRLGFVVASAQLASGKAALLEARAPAIDLDVAEPDPTTSSAPSNRCSQRAATRASICGGATTCACATDAECPPAYFCLESGVADRCWPEEYATSGAACDSASERICASSSCNNGLCE